MIRERGLFVAYENHLGPGKGGVQKCTREYMEVLAAAGLELEVLAVNPDQRLSTRIGRRINTSTYWRPIHQNGIRKLVQSLDEFEFVFLNQVSLAGALSSEEMKCHPARKILLSHGCEITDLLHLARLVAKLPLSARQLGVNKELALGLTLRAEFRTRAHIDGAICISPYDADTEAWLGTRRVCWIPRTIEPRPLERRPEPGLFGFVGTLDHAPNLEGLVAVLEEMEASGVDGLNIRVVGGPERIGTWLERSFKNVVYLGRLDDEALVREVKSWEAFLNPIFCLARGCSTKLADPISWAMPILTSSPGRRGYCWSKGGLIEANDPLAFVAAMQSFVDAEFRLSARQGVQEVAETSPRVSEVGVQVADFLGRFPKSAEL